MKLDVLEKTNARAENMQTPHRENSKKDLNQDLTLLTTAPPYGPDTNTHKHTNTAYRCITVRASSYPVC